MICGILQVDLITLCLLVLSADNFCRQFGCRPDPTEHQAKYGSEMFDTVGIAERIFLKKKYHKKSADDKKERKITH